eukprot:GHVT01098070.1.p1 GENE.GHVT01098070.1~~GHVT01098070.1.p1  ORF type:complete len:286 (+),score=20.68 GHVT01098070.1:325-1182(+)
MFPNPQPTKMKRSMTAMRATQTVFIIGLVLVGLLSCSFAVRVAGQFAQNTHDEDFKFVMNFPEISKQRGSYLHGFSAANSIVKYEMLVQTNFPMLEKFDPENVKLHETKSINYILDLFRRDTILFVVDLDGMVEKMRSGGSEFSMFALPAHLRDVKSKIDELMETTIRPIIETYEDRVEGLIVINVPSLWQMAFPAAFAAIPLLNRFRHKIHMLDVAQLSKFVPPVQQPAEYSKTPNAPRLGESRQQRAFAEHMAGLYNELSARSDVPSPGFPGVMDNTPFVEGY